MSMEEDLHKLKFKKKEEPNNCSLAIAEITMRIKQKLPDSKKTAHILRIGKFHYADVLAANEGPVDKLRSDRAPVSNS